MSTVVRYSENYNLSLLITCEGCASAATATGDADGGDIPILHFKRRPAETEKAYVRRMENETQHILFLSKNQVDRMPELDEDKQEKHGSKGKSEKKKEWVYGTLYQRKEPTA